MQNNIHNLESAISDAAEVLANMDKHDQSLNSMQEAIKSACLSRALVKKSIKLTNGNR